MPLITSINEHLCIATDAFERRFNRKPRFAALAPGRVNLIGEHTDYNDGFVLPMAIERETIIVADRAAGRNATIHSLGVDEPARFEIGRDLLPGEPAWSNYVRGVVSGCAAVGLDPGGFDALIDSTVPLGGGLSSSAALEVATATLIEAMTGQTLRPIDKIMLCQKAEHDFAGVPCGIMDQTVVTLAQAGHTMLLDCRSLQTRMVPIADPGVVVLITNSNIKHALTGGEYGQRRAQCQAAARAMNAPSLRDVTMKDLVAARLRMNKTDYQRAYHVVGEIARTLQAAEAAVAGDWVSLGRLMVKSHASLRDDFEVSCRELDVLVDLACELGTDGGIWGSRMTGGGFGGCTVSLVRADALERVSKHLTHGYQKATGINATVFATRPAAGARVLQCIDP